MKEIIDAINEEWKRCYGSHTMICGCGEYLQGLEFCLKLLMGEKFNYANYGRTHCDGKKVKPTEDDVVTDKMRRAWALK